MSFCKYCGNELIGGWCFCKNFRKEKEITDKIQQKAKELDILEKELCGHISLHANKYWYKKYSVEISRDISAYNKKIAVLKKYH